MEIKYNGFTIGYQSFIDFSTMENTCCAHVCTLRLMKTPDGSSYVIAYTWVDPLSKTYDDKAEAFYIDGINKDNEEEAKEILFEVYNDLLEAYKENPYRMFNMNAYVKNNFSSGALVKKRKKVITNE